MMKTYTLKDLEKILHVGERTLFRYLKSGKLTGANHGKWLFTEEDVDALLKRGRKKARTRKK